jgi:copper(I)-binding protein
MRFTAASCKEWRATIDPAGRARRRAPYAFAQTSRIATLFLAIALLAHASAALAVFVVNDPWVKAAPGAKSAEAFMELTSSEGASVVAVRSDAVARVTIRGPGKSTAAIPELLLAPRVALLLAPGKYRFGLVGLAQPLKLGDRVPLVLTVRNSDGSEREIPISAEVRKRSAIEDHLRGAHGHTHAH